jgi:hypothetical protein
MSTISADMTSRQPKQIRSAWTDEEEAIFLDIFLAQMKDIPSSMWQAVKEDGRLAYRGNMGIRSHCQAHVSDLYPVALSRTLTQDRSIR